jgi:pilus assembly protein CpaE
MSTPLSVLLIDSDPLRRHALRDLLKDHDGVRVEAEAADPETGAHLVSQIKPGIVLFDLGTPPDPGLALIERLVAASPQSAIFVTADAQRAETILRAVRAGAQEFLVRPVSKKELLGAVHRIARQRALVSSDSAPRGKVVTVFGCKGGRGTTVLALNLAVALARHQAGPVVAVDLDLQAGDLSLLLNLKPAYTIYDAVVNMDRLDAVFLKSLLCEHPSGVSVLAAPLKLEEADRISPLRISQLLSLLKASFAYVVVDTPPTYDERTLAALDAAGELLLVVAPDVASLYHAQRCLDLFDRLAYPPANVKLLLTRCPAPNGKATKVVQEVLKRSVLWDFPEDEAVVASLISGEPLASGGASSPLASRFMVLAAQVDRRKGSNAIQRQTSNGFRRFLRAGAFDFLRSAKGDDD